MTSLREIPLIAIELSGRTLRYSDRDIHVREDGILNFYLGYLTKYPEIRESANLEESSISTSTFKIDLGNVDRFQDIIQANLLDGASVTFKKYDFDKEVVLDVFAGIIVDYNWTEQAVSIKADAKAEKIFIRIPENFIREDSFNETFKGIADTWDTGWQQYWITDSDLAGFDDGYWADGKIRLKTINPGFKDKSEFIEKRVTAFVKADERVFWELWRPTWRSFTIGRGLRGGVRTNEVMIGLSGAADLNASTSYELEKSFIPENSDDVLGEYYPIVYGYVEKMHLRWIAASFRHNDDKYLLAGHEIFDTTSSEILLYYDLDEKDPPGEVVNVVAGNIPNPIRVTHHGRVTSIDSTNSFFDRTVDSTSDSDSIDLIGNFQHFETNFWRDADITFVDGEGQSHRRKINDNLYGGVQDGRITMTTPIYGLSPGESGFNYVMDLRGYDLVNDVTDNFANKISYAQLKGNASANVLGARLFTIPNLYWNLRNGLGSSKVYGSFRGHKDDELGTVTGVPNNLIENPIDVIKHFMLNYTLIRDNVSLLDSDSFDEARKNRIGWALGGAITEQEEGEELLQRFCLEAGAIYFWKNGKFKIKAVDILNPRPKFNFIENVNVYEKPKVSKSSVKDISNNILIKYDYSWVSDEKVGSIIKDQRTDSICRASVGKYGESEQREIELEDISSYNTANNLANYFVRLLADVFYEVTFKVNKEFRDIELGDMIYFTHSIGIDIEGVGWEDKIMVITEVRRKFESIELKARTFTIV